MPSPERPPGTPTFINAGAGFRGHGGVASAFDDWREIRVDLDPAVDPDLVGSITDLSEIPDGVADAVWSSHCLEHLFAHEVPKALAEFRRVLNHRGFLYLLVPDMQAAALLIAEDRATEAIYDSQAGPVTPHDMVFGYTPALAAGRHHMAHRCGFTRTLLQRLFSEADYGDFVVARHEPALELRAVASRRKFESPERRAALLTGLGL